MGRIFGAFSSKTKQCNAKIQVGSQVFMKFPYKMFRCSFLWNFRWFSIENKVCCSHKRSIVCKPFVRLKWFSFLFIQFEYIRCFSIALIKTSIILELCSNWNWNWNTFALCTELWEMAKNVCQTYDSKGIPMNQAHSAV